MNPKLLAQIQLAKQTGSDAMAKDFFAKTPGIQGGTGDAPPAGRGGADDSGAQQDSPGADAPPGKPGVMGDVQTNPDAENAPKLTPEMLQELLALIKQQGGGGDSGQGQ